MATSLKHPVADPFPGDPEGLVPVRRVLVSVFDKTGLDRLAAVFGEAGVRVASTGGTRTALEKLGLDVEDVSTITGFPEVLDGRVKTLHPRIFAGLLARRHREADRDMLAEHGIETFDAVIVNLYPFERIAGSPDATADECIELIDIGGPSLVRAAAKNHLFTTVVSSPDQYEGFFEAITRGGTTLAERKRFAARAFERTAEYDRRIAAWMAAHAGVEGCAGSDGDRGPLPEQLSLDLERRMPLRYGENPHQPAALYCPAGSRGGLAGLLQLSGKELSYNNLADLDAAMRVAWLVEEPAAVVVKHTNPCGAAAASTLATAVATAIEADPTSAFGGIVAVNRPFDRESAEVLLAPGLFLEVIAAPAFAADAVDLLTTKPSWKGNVRLVTLPAGDPWAATHGLELKTVAGGLLAQKPDDAPEDRTSWKVVTKAPLPAGIDGELAFAFSVVRRLSSNAIAICKGKSLVGAGVGQTSRVDAVRHAIEKAGERGRAAVLASDAFFPFPDSVELAAKAGIAAIIQPGGSKRDPEVIAACDAVGLPMVFTSRRHFRH